MPSRSRRRSRSVRMFGAMPTSSASSLKRREPSRRASTISRLQRSPTRSRASSRGVAGSSDRGGIRVMVGDVRYLPDGVCGSNLQVASHFSTRSTEIANTMSAIEEFQFAITAVAEQVGPSIVGIGSHHRGSGVVLADGKVLTNAHNIRGDEVTVTFADGRSSRGQVAGVDFDGDLAVVNVDTAGAKALEWADGSDVALGTLVFGAAATSGGGTRVTFGTVSAVARAFRGPGGRRIAGSIEHTAPLASGSSGPRNARATAETVPNVT